MNAMNATKTDKRGKLTSAKLNDAYAIDALFNANKPKIREITMNDPIIVTMPETAYEQGKEARQAKQDSAFNRVVFMENAANGFARSIVTIRFDKEQTTMGYVSEITLFADGTKQKSVQLGYATRNDDGTFVVPSALTDKRKQTLKYYVKGAIKARGMRQDVLRMERAKQGENSAMVFVTGYDQRTKTENEAWLSDFAIAFALKNPKTTAAKVKSIVTGDDVPEMDNL